MVQQSPFTHAVESRWIQIFQIDGTTQYLVKSGRNEYSFLRLEDAQRVAHDLSDTPQDDYPITAISGQQIDRYGVQSPFGPAQAALTDMPLSQRVS